METRNTVKLEVVTNERHQSLVEKDMVLRFYKANDKTVDEISGISPHAYSAYEKAMCV